MVLIKFFVCGDGYCLITNKCVLLIPVEFSYPGRVAGRQNPENRPNTISEKKHKHTLNYKNHKNQMTLKTYKLGTPLLFMLVDSGENPPKNLALYQQ